MPRGECSCSACAYKLTCGWPVIFVRSGVCPSEEHQQPSNGSAELAEFFDGCHCGGMDKLLTVW